SKKWSLNSSVSAKNKHSFGLSVSTHSSRATNGSASAMRPAFILTKAIWIRAPGVGFPFYLEGSGRNSTCWQALRALRVPGSEFQVGFSHVSCKFCNQVNRLLQELQLEDCAHLDSVVTT